MNMQARDVVAKHIRNRIPGFSLPAEMYKGQDFFEVDLDVFFNKHWIVAGVDADIVEPGDAMVLDIGRTSVLMMRGEAGDLRAFHNVCRHRGARLISECKTNVGRIVCPYHQWSYDLDGSLVHAASMGKGFDHECHSLKPIHIRSIGGIIMICVNPDAPEDITDLEAVMAPRLAPFDLLNAKIAFEKVIIEEGNWKLSIDNNRECYHCAGSHPELNISIHPLDLTCDMEGLSAEERDEWDSHVAQTEANTVDWERTGFPSRLVEEMSGRATIFRTHRFAIAGAGESHTMDTEKACRRLFGNLKDPKLGDLHFWTHNSWHHFFADHAVVSYLVPLSPDRTELRSVWLVHKDAVEGMDYDIGRMTAVWVATNQEDADLVKIAQQGVKTTGYSPGPLSESLERLVELNLRWYVERMQTHGY